MTDGEMRKYIREIFNHCKIGSILVINKKGSMEHLDCTFEVLVIQDVGELEKDLV